ncbi:GntR family transcriptional regulator [Microbacterium lacticum]|uniref:GntR family transcriptional regulator n=1 Tax=Microbacterium lacticum TaxID=33885 RepID=A0A4Y3UQ17_9MICO|nr:GntR family transcriptional regulator [Microbacterium lacticum]TQM90258.1 GntR family transcriptional regulator [Microbacterium lacticum]GEB96463.1 GntR family transcriptional regulator [Microbacterium lacticum]GGI74686.1 GntR family transcriptional regulator [Microbacterium lacticum]
MLFRVDQASSASLADQIALQVRAGIVSGELSPGERLPAARDLATALRVNMHTVLRAYARLREEGLIEMRQGRGAWVRPEANATMVRIGELASQLAAEARKIGLTPQEVSRLVELS